MVTTALYGKPHPSVPFVGYDSTLFLSISAFLPEETWASFARRDTVPVMSGDSLHEAGSAVVSLTQSPGSSLDVQPSTNTVTGVKAVGRHDPRPALALPKGQVC